MWNDLTMRERADLIRQGVALGYKDIDSIRNNYHIFGKGSTLNSSRILILIIIGSVTMIKRLGEISLRRDRSLIR